MLNKALIRPIHRGSRLNDIQPRVPGEKHLILINASLGYHNLELGDKLSYLTTFSCPFGRYGYARLPFGAAPAGNMFLKKIDGIFSGMPNIFGIADDTLIADFDEHGRDREEMLEKVLWIRRQSNLKLNKYKCLFTCANIPFGKIISQ